MEIPGGEVAVLPELIRGHPSPNGFDLTAACFGTVALDAVVTGSACRPGDALIGLPSTGLHSNGYSLARRALEGLALDERPAVLGGASVADALLEPTMIYVRAVLELLRSDADVRGLAHITGGGLLNLLRLHADIGFEITDPLPVPPVFELVRELGGVGEAEMWEVFNMGCGFAVVVPEAARPPPRPSSRPTTPAPAGSARSPRTPTRSPSRRWDRRRPGGPGRELARVLVLVGVLLRRAGLAEDLLLVDLATEVELVGVDVAALAVALPGSPVSSGAPGTPGSPSCAPSPRRRPRCRPAGSPSAPRGRRARARRSRPSPRGPDGLRRSSPREYPRRGAQSLLAASSSDRPRSSSFSRR